MERQIKFRGKTINEGEWVYGDLEYNRAKNIARIHTYDEKGEYLMQHLVEPESVGQFSGLLDKNDSPIYEGDIVEAYDLDEELAFMGAVRYALPDAAFGIDKGTGASLGPFEGNMTYKVVGNFHDNIESLNGK